VIFQCFRTKGVWEMDAVRTSHFTTIVSVNQITAVVLRIFIRLLDKAAARCKIAGHRQFQHRTVR
jgi:hypothetical protein